MKKITGILFVLAAMQLFGSAQAQDTLTIEGRVAGILTRLPAHNSEETFRLMEEMYSLGDDGRSVICRQVIPAGTGDDTKARYAVSSLTYHLSGDKGRDRKEVWEKQCIGFMKEAAQEEVRVFFMRQLNTIGSGAAVEALADYTKDSILCDDAVITLQSIGSEEAVRVLSSSVSEAECPCAAQVMVALAEKQFTAGVQDYIRWYKNGSQAEQSAALYALAVTGDPAALSTLTKAAEDAGFEWDPTGAVQALLLYARRIGLAGNVKGMEKITDQIISRSTTAATTGQRLAAMSVKVAVKGADALSMLLEAADDPDIVIRSGAMRLTSSLPGTDVTKKWISRYDKVHAEAKPQIIFMLGERGDQLAVPLMLKALNDPSQDAAAEAAAALAKLQGQEAVDPLLAWILNYDTEEGHMAAANALTTVLDSSRIIRLTESLPKSHGHATVTLLWLLAWTGNNEYFATIMSYTGSSDLGVRAAAITSLERLASCNDQMTLINLLEDVTEKAEISELQRALASAALRCEDPLKRSEVILSIYGSSTIKLKLVPVLSQTGGDEALKTVLKEFENGDAETRDVCFDALAYWSDYTAASALLEITASGNKTFGRPAFDAYLRMVSIAPLTPEQKLNLIGDIAPHALAPDARIEMIALAASLMTSEAGVFISSFLDDDVAEVREAAGEALGKLSESGINFQPPKQKN